MPEPGTLLDLDNFICFAVYETNQEFNRFYRSILEEIGLTYTQYLVMVALWAEDGTTVKEIGQSVSLDSGTLTPLLKRLEGLGLVSRYRDQIDERLVRIRLTEQGRALKGAAEAVPKALSKALALSDGEFADLHRKMTDVRKRLRSHNARQE